MTKTEANKTISLIKVQLRAGQPDEATLGLKRLLRVREEELAKILRIAGTRSNRQLAGKYSAAPERARMS
ncbi:MAG: hypothetical protein QOH31_6487 [Verrucomicrobiota bacterium]|jgi:hypothetical protein